MLLCRRCLLEYPDKLREVELGEALTLLRRAENQAQGFRQQMEDATDFEDHGVTLYRPYMLNLVDPKIVGV